VSATLRIVLAEDHALVRAGLRALLAGQEGVEVVREVGDGRAALDAVRELSPDLVLLDISMPGLNGLEACRRLTKDAPRTRVLILSVHKAVEYVHAAFRAGAMGYLHKESDAAELGHALRTVARGERYLSPEFPVDIVARPPDSSEAPGSVLERLTSRQREVLQLVAEGHTTKAIAARLDLSVKTVETHRSELMRRLEVHDVASLVRIAVQEGLVGSDR
jgi:DNA-binding NarL/FixJ family response regulator